MCITLAKCTGHTTGQGVTRFEQLKSSQALANDDTDFISKEGKTEPTPTFQGKTQAELGPTRTNPPSNRNQGRTAKRRKLKLSSERVDLADNQSTRSSETDSLNMATPASTSDFASTPPRAEGLESFPTVATPPVSPLTERAAA